MQELEVFWETPNIAVKEKYGIIIYISLKVISISYGIVLRAKS